MKRTELATSYKGKMRVHPGLAENVQTIIDVLMVRPLQEGRK